MGVSPTNELGHPLVAAFEMYDEGIAMLRQRLCREDPLATEDQIDALVAEWIADRPYDSPGRVRRP